MPRFFLHFRERRLVGGRRAHASHAARSRVTRARRWQRRQIDRGERHGDRADMASAAAVRKVLARIDELCAQDRLPVASVNAVHGVTVPKSEGGTGQVVVVLECEPKPQMPWQPKLKPEFAFFEQFVGADGIMDAQEAWHEAHFEPDMVKNALWQRHHTPAQAAGEIINSVIAEARSKESTATYIKSVLCKSCGEEAGTDYYSRLVVEGDAAMRHSLVCQSVAWLDGLQWQQCFYSSRNCPSHPSWKGSPWEYENVMSKLLPGLARGKIGIELVVSKCSDEAASKKYRLTPWRRMYFDGVPERFIIQLRDAGALPTGGESACQSFWELLAGVDTPADVANAPGKKRAATPTTASAAVGGPHGGPSKKAKSKLGEGAGSSQATMDAFLTQFTYKKK